jgi:hypothetical protein
MRVSGQLSGGATVGDPAEETAMPDEDRVAPLYDFYEHLSVEQLQELQGVTGYVDLAKFANNDLTDEERDALVAACASEGPETV